MKLFSGIHKKNGTWYFTRQQERTFFFYMTIIMLTAGLGSKFFGL